MTRLCAICFRPQHPLWTLTCSNDYMKVQLAKLKAEQEKSGKKSEHKVGSASYSFRCQWDVRTCWY